MLFCFPLKLLVETSKHVNWGPSSQLQEVAVPEVLYEEVVEVDERVVLEQVSCQLPRKDARRIVTGVRNSPILFHRRYHASHFG